MHSNPNEERLQAKILLSIGQEVMLCSNLWVEIGLVNGSLGQIKSIVYNDGEKPPQLLLFVVVWISNITLAQFGIITTQKYPYNPTKSWPMSLLKMAWALTIHKLESLTVQRVAIDIDNIDWQGLTFTTISRVRELPCLCIQPSFTFQIYAHMQQCPYVAHPKKIVDCLNTLSHSKSSTN